MSEPNVNCRALRKVAVVDGFGASSEVHLTLEDMITGDTVDEEVPWPGDWPKWVSRQFLEAKGWKVVTA